MEFQAGLNQVKAESSKLTETSHPKGVAGATVLDYVITTALLLASTCSFIYGNTQTRAIILILSLTVGIIKPHLLIFSLSLASSLDMDQHNVLSPMRIVVAFTVVALLIRIKRISTCITKYQLQCLAYYVGFGLWCILCELVRLDIDNIPSTATIFVYSIICMILLIILDGKYSISTYMWIGLAPSAIVSILAALHLRVIYKYEYLITAIGPRYRGIVNDPNYLSSILLVGFTTCLLCFKTQQGALKKISYLAAMSAFAFSIWMTQSRGGIYTAAFCLALFIVLQVGYDLRNIKLGSILLMSLIGILTVTFLISNSQSRVFSASKEQGVMLVRRISQEAVTPILENPIFGPGEDAFVKRYGTAPHNTMLSIGLEYGIVGMLLMLLTISYSFFNLWRYRKKGSIIYFFPLLALNIVLCSFSSPGHKLLWFYLVAAAIFHERALRND
jgi:O-antigen ligase